MSLLHLQIMIEYRTHHFCMHKQKNFRLCFCIMLSFALENEDEKLAYPTMVIGILWTVGEVFRVKNSILIFKISYFSPRDIPGTCPRTNGLIRTIEILLLDPDTS